MRVRLACVNGTALAGDGRTSPSLSCTHHGIKMCGHHEPRARIRKRWHQYGFMFT